MSDPTDFPDTDGAQGFVLLSNGDRVRNDSLAWLDECRARLRHVNTLLSMSGHGSLIARREYVATVARREGNESARRLTEALGKAWEKRRAEEAQARKEIKP